MNQGDMVNAMEFLAPLWNYVLPFLVILTLLVFVHEMGHYYVARRAGVKIEAFSIGFGPEIFGWNDRRGTRWRFAAIPLGGYVKMFGETERLPEEGDRPLTREEKAVSFHHKRLGQRAAIVFAGPFVNYAFAVLVLGLLFATAGQPFSPSIIGPMVSGGAAEKAGLRTGDKIVQVAGRNVERFEEVMQAVGIRPGQRVPIVIERDGRQRALDVDVGVRVLVDKRGNETPFGDLGAGPFVPPVVGRVVAKSAAAEAGLVPGDVFLKIQGRPIETFADVQKIVSENAEVPLEFVVRRGGADVALVVTPKRQLSKEKDKDGSAKKLGGVIGVAPQAAFRKQHGVFDAFVQAVRETYGLTVSTFTAVGQMIAGTRSTRDLSGPLRIAEISGDMAQTGLYQYVWFLGVLSLSLCIINLLPVPMLDGGHLLFYGFEALRGKPLGQRAQEYGFRIGLALVITLMVFATWNDLVHLKVIESIRSLFV
jgi:regulator of sigma E protease